MFNRVVTVLGTGLAFAMTAGSAFAPPTVAIPEPTTMSVFGIVAVGGLIAKKFWGRK